VQVTHRDEPTCDCRDGANLNARDQTIARTYSVRGFPEATVSTPIAL
jgi:hypothetical protein